MIMDKQIDIIDESLRLFYLESAKEAASEEGPSPLESVLHANVSTEMTAANRERMFIRLSDALLNPTFGQVISESMTAMKISVEHLSEQSMLTLESIEEITEDKIHANKIPVMILKELLKLLQISFQKAEKSIRKSFEILQSGNLDRGGASAFSLARRKSVFISKSSYSDGNQKADAKELYENDEALTNYLKRLEQLM
jgi:hypothetical protein